MKRRRARALALASLLVVAGAVLINVTPFNHLSPFIPGESFATEPASEEMAASAAQADGAAFAVPVGIDAIADTRLLELVNGDYAINGEPDAARIVAASPVVATESTGVRLQETALNAISELFDAARAAGAGSFYVSSGYRGAAEQQRLYDEAPDKSYVQTPGHSEHQTGLAVDIGSAAPAPGSSGTPDSERWLAENAWRYGLILRYPEDKTAITQIAYEPWHFRYVGQPHARYIQEHGLCLEEYIQFLKDSGGYSMTADGVNYIVKYEQPENDTIWIPEGGNFDVSGDNTGGYIVTVREQ